MKLYYLITLVFLWPNFQPQERNCVLLLGTWESYKIQHSSSIKDNSKVRFTFYEDGYLCSDTDSIKYNVNEDCTKLSLGEEIKFSIDKLTADTLILELRFLPHEVQVISFKKVK